MPDCGLATVLSSTMIAMGSLWASAAGAPTPSRSAYAQPVGSGLGKRSGESVGVGSAVGVSVGDGDADGDGSAVGVADGVAEATAWATAKGWATTKAVAATVTTARPATATASILRFARIRFITGSISVSRTCQQHSRGWRCGSRPDGPPYGWARSTRF